MPWKETNVLDQRTEFVTRALTEEITFTDLCKEYGISRKTGYKWKQRFLENGYNGLSDLSRKPRNSPNQLSEDCIIQIIKLKLAYPNWGARKILELYKRAHPLEKAPSESSVKRILDKAGLVKKRRVKRVNPNQDALRQMIQPDEPNDVWTIDFKGWWFSTDKNKCVPLTIRDDKSRYLQDIRLMKSQTTEAVQHVLANVFKEYGLPKVIRSDNGSPFAAPNSILGLCRLAAWWMSLGIIPDRIRPGCPYQNGGHERMHRDLKLEIQKPHKGDLPFFQNIIDEWRCEFNNVRPHEALGYKTPSEVYKPSERKYDGDIDEIIYPLGFETRKVSSNGTIKIKGVEVHLTTALTGYHVGLLHTENRVMDVWFNKFPLGSIDLNSFRFYTAEKGA
jgi:putative transposase